MKKGKRRGIYAVSLMVLFLICIVCISKENVYAQELELQNVHVLESDSFDICDNSIVDSYGNEYSENIVRFDASESGYVSYDLNGQYESFGGKIVTSDETGSGAVISLGIFADGELVYSKTNITRQMAGEDFQIDVTNVGKLEIKTLNAGGYSSGWVFIVNGVAVESADTAIYPEYSPLRDTFLIDGKEIEVKKRLMTDSYGEVHNGYIKFDTGEGGYALYNLNEKFITFHASLVTSEDTEPDAVMGIEIFLDDQLAFSQNGITKQSERTEISLDVTNVKVMKIVAHSEEYGWYNYLYLVDDILKPHVHTPGEWEVFTEPTCTEEGTKVQYCLECNEICNTGTLDAVGHTPAEEFVVEKEASCAEEGLMVKKCKECGEVCEKKAIPKLEHEAEGEWTVLKEADCQNEGEKVKKCKNCGEICEREVIEKKDHVSESDWTTLKEADCQSEGEKAKKCKNCGEILETRPIERLEHVPSDTVVELVAPQCTESGTGAVYCEKCGALLENTVIPAKGHNFGHWTRVSGSIWNVPIIKERVCSSCLYRESKKSYALIWVKPIIILLIIAAVLGVIWYILCKHCGIKPEKGNFKTVFGEEVTKLKERLGEQKEKYDKQNEERRSDDGDDILNRHGK